MSGIGWPHPAVHDMIGTMHKLHQIAKPGEGLRPELRALYERLAKDRYCEQFIRADGMVQSGPDPERDASQAESSNEPEGLVAHRR
jgi:hypothetical protein